MIGFIIVCSLGVVSGVSLYREGVFTPAPPGGRPPCATKGKTFCENVDEYPTKIIQKLLSSKFTSLDDFFTDESEGPEEPPEFLFQEVPEEDTKGGRKGRSVSEGNTSMQDLEKACPLLSRAVRPQLAANSRGEWRFIVQDGENNQTVEVQLCDQTENCRNYCTQFHTRVPLISVDPSGRFHKDSFWLPSFCICQTQPLDDLLS